MPPPSVLAELAPFGLHFSEWALVVLALYFVLDIMGLSRSARTIRRQNGDLRERNATLEGEVAALQERVDSLTKQVDELKARSVDSLIATFRVHDERMTKAMSELTQNVAGLVAAANAHEANASRRNEELVSTLRAITASSG